MTKKLIFYIFYICLAPLFNLQASQGLQKEKLERAISSLDIEKIRTVLIENSSLNIQPIFYNRSLTQIITHLNILYSSPTFVDAIFCSSHKTYHQVSIENTLKIVTLLLQHKADPTIADFASKELSPLAKLMTSYIFLKDERNTCKAQAMQRTMVDIVRLSSQYGIDLNITANVDLKPLGIHENLSFISIISWLTSPLPQITNK